MVRRLSFLPAMTYIVLRNKYRVAELAMLACDMLPGDHGQGVAHGVASQPHAFSKRTLLCTRHFQCGGLILSGSGSTHNTATRLSFASRWWCLHRCRGARGIARGERPPGAACARPLQRSVDPYSVTLYIREYSRHRDFSVSRSDGASPDVPAGLLDW